VGNLEGKAMTWNRQAIKWILATALLTVFGCSCGGTGSGGPLDLRRTPDLDAVRDSTGETAAVGPEASAWHDTAPDAADDLPKISRGDISPDDPADTPPDAVPEVAAQDTGGNAWLTCGHGVVSRQETAEGIEYRFFRGKQHFLSLLHLESGALVLRPHPSLTELDAWGSSCTLMTFLAGADARDAQVPVVDCTAEGFRIQAAGIVATGASGKAGDWSWDIEMRYLPEQERVTGNGIYKIDIDSNEGTALTDANLYRVASSFLSDVPLLSGGTGDTGDMSKVEVDGGTFQFTWVPDEQVDGFFPTDQTNRLEVEVLGAYNEVDTAAQGYAPIKPAHKPTIRIVLETVDGKPVLSFGAMYDLEASKQFWADTVGVLALRLKPVSGETLELKVSFDSVPEGPVP
jgi:hypothetical protein